MSAGSKNKARNQLRESHGKSVNAKWFNLRIKRNRVRDRMAKESRRRNRGRA